MQLLGNKSEESEQAMGLGLIDGNTELLTSNPKEKIPHIGWNEVSINSGGSSFNSLNCAKDFYFVHSYHLVPKNSSDIHTKTPFGDGSFSSTVLRGRVLGFQFHPEKSGSVGLKLIEEVIHWAENET
jgi:glutamine amidotransferase